MTPADQMSDAGSTADLRTSGAINLHHTHPLTTHSRVTLRLQCLCVSQYLRPKQGIAASLFNIQLCVSKQR